MVLNEMISLMPLQGWISPLNDFFVFWGFFLGFAVVVLRQNLTVEAKMTWNLLCQPAWTQNSH